MSLKTCLHSYWEHHSKQRRWAPVLITATLLIVVGMGYVGYNVHKQISYLRQPVPTLFRASAQVHSLAFTIGNSPDSAGLFTSETARVNLVLTTSSILESNEPAGPAAVRNCSPNTTFENVNLVRIATGPNVRIALEAASGLLRYTLTPPQGTSDPSLLVSIPRTTQIKNLACTPESKTLPPGEWRIRAAQPGDFLEFTVRFLPARNSGKTTAAPEPEQDIHLATPTSLQLHLDPAAASSSNASAIAPNRLRLVRTGRVVPLIEGIDLTQLYDAAIQQLSFDPDKALLTLSLVGSAKHIGVRVGPEDIEEGELRYAAYRPRTVIGVLSSGGTMFGAIATAASAIVTFIGWWLPQNKKADSTPDKTK